MRLFRTAGGPVVEESGRQYLLADANWDEVVNRRGLAASLRASTSNLEPLGTPLSPAEFLAPLARQEVWAAGVTYFRSRDARMEESQEAGGGDFYARVYEAERPELFFKATAHRVSGPGQAVRIRSDARWSVPEPELALFVTSAGTIEGYTIGNDMSSRDIEGENPLYLPQAKIYDGSCGLGPGVLVTSEALPADTRILLEIERKGARAFAGSTTIARMKRRPSDLVSWLWRDQTFPHGCFLLTGTGVVPPPDFTLLPGDLVRIAIDGIGVLENPVADVVRRSWA
jgi:2-dehydro-3-deoxy-D-arabinonate dehydratase